MKKILLFFIVFTSALTIVFAIKGKAFSPYEYIEKTTKQVNSLSIPKFPTLDIEVSTISTLKSYYVDESVMFESDIIYEDTEVIDDKFVRIYQLPYQVEGNWVIIGNHTIRYSTNEIIDFTPTFIRIENVEKCTELWHENHARFVPHYVEVEEDFNVSTFINWIIAPFKFLFNLLIYIGKMFIYIIRVITIFGGGLLV